ncbi:hypothetical protein L198_07456 [Cryptococcus wingfieldii CBS 7118]|uniref:Uncharacterized protein n=1 Tax=Cryptococcus wingfieldii CBS 7118 TaxID=1295528 RepID=A0A1E3IB92_9TREE|nr:hypothetical protein L198_07456 [Cryptococcus wingfieldii CBS 7118]ODN85889.1 hypothetical protein L198_07456 [Cryptococcus wingfieldii CBS 7118]
MVSSVLLPSPRSTTYGLCRSECNSIITSPTASSPHSLHVQIVGSLAHKVDVLTTISSCLRHAAEEARATESSLKALVSDLEDRVGELEDESWRRQVREAAWEERLRRLEADTSGGDGKKRKKKKEDLDVSKDERVSMRFRLREISYEHPHPSLLLRETAEDSDGNVLRLHVSSESKRWHETTDDGVLGDGGEEDDDDEMEEDEGEGAVESGQRRKSVVFRPKCEAFGDPRRATRNRRDPLATSFAASPAPSKPHAPTLSSLLKDRPKLLASVEKSSRAVRSFESTEALRRMWCARETWAEDRYKLLLDEGDAEAAVNVLTSSDFAESEQGDGDDVHQEDSESDDE